MSRIWLLLFLGLNMLAFGDSKTVVGQDQLEFETAAAVETEPVTQASLEELVPSDEFEVQAPRIVFRAVNPASIERGDESYEIRFEPIQDGSGQKRIRLWVPSSVAEIEITHRTKHEVDELATNRPLMFNSNETFGESLEQKDVNLNGEFAEKFRTTRRLVPQSDNRTGYIKNPYFSDVNSVPPLKIQLPKEYATTGYQKLVETHTENLESEASPANPVAKPSRAVQVRLTDLDDSQ